jgi:translation elongation factor P/translation initiation factor 5A
MSDTEKMARELADKFAKAVMEKHNTTVCYDASPILIPMLQQALDAAKRDAEAELIKKIIKQGEGVPITSCVDMEAYEQICCERDTIQSKADKLAEALSKLIPLLIQDEEDAVTGIFSEETYAAIKQSKQALAEWDGEKT